MSASRRTGQAAGASLKAVAAMLVAMCPARRAKAIREALSFRPADTFEDSFDLGPLRAALADYWESAFGEAVPITCLREVMQPPVTIGVVLQLWPLGVLRGPKDLASSVATLIDYLRRECDTLSEQRLLFTVAPDEDAGTRSKAVLPGIIGDLNQLLGAGIRFPTIYADPPWEYANRASNGAAANHYPSMTLDEIRNEPVDQLAADQAHLHLWTTSGFLKEGFEVIEAWGFEYKSCLVWVKPELGMGNYWRVSHEYLLLGVRGRLTFRDRAIRSWLEASRTTHSSKPAIVRSLIERVSPGPYLELYGRTELPESQWTVYGNQVERMWF